MTTPWKKLDGNYPNVTVSGFAFDFEGRFPILHRSNNVRSARNCWSLPSGLHEIGKNLESQFKAELEEELGLKPLPAYEHIGVYENITPSDGYHWVIHLQATLVESLENITNKEPDKHDEIRLIRISDIPEYYGSWAPSLEEALIRHASRIEAAFASCAVAHPILGEPILQG